MIVSPLNITREWQGQLFVLRGPIVNTWLEAGGGSTFTASLVPGTASLNSQMPTNLFLGIWAAAGAPVLTPPAGLTAIDNYNTAIIASRTVMFAYKVANATGLIAPATATSSIAATGREFSLMIRDRAPITPRAFVTETPGNIGLLGRDSRPSREVGTAGGGGGGGS
ncbi:MAG: hypothetical protein H0U52_06835 [Chloroflexi bacterium]|nr:hypothetical protein [Chloroflexota bacterium]